MSIYEKDIKAAIEVMRKGGVILYPTDTVWGIGCDATNADAVARVFELKKRPEAKSLVTLVADLILLFFHTISFNRIKSGLSMQNLRLKK